MELDINKVSEQEYKFQLAGVDKTATVAIQIPSLNSLEFSTWGDWGLMYAFRLKESEPVKISYNKDWRSLDIKTLQIESPIRAFEREAYPFYILVEDSETDFAIYLYLNRQFEMGKVVVKRLSDQSHLYETSRMVEPLCEVFS